MNAACTSLDTSHLLRNILHNKDNYQAQFIDNNNSTSGLKDVYVRGCNSEMISPLLQSKSSDMAYNARENETDFDNDGDIDVATDTASCINGGDQSDDLDERSLDTSGQEDSSKGIDHQSFLVDSKEAKRAHVENILTNMRQSPPQDTMDSSTSALAGDLKRQKRKQPQPQQHEVITLHSEELALQRQILQLQEQMQAVKRKREEDLSANDDDDVIDDDVTDVESSKPNSPLPGVIKRARVENILSSMRSSPQLDGGVELSNRISPGSENGKKQKRKQTQPQQHDRSEHTSNNSKYNIKIDEGHLNNEDNVSDVNNQSGLYGAHPIFRNNFFHPMADKDCVSAFHNGFDPHIYRENIFRHNFFGIRPDLDPIATTFKKVSKIAQLRSEAGGVGDEQPKIATAELTRIAVALKSELTQAVSNAIDSAVSKVFSEKQTSINSQSAATAETNSQQQQQQHDDRHHHQEHQQSFQQQNHQQPTNSFPHFPHPNHQFQHQHRLHHHQQQQQQQQQSLPNQFSEREALKETVNNSQGKKKADLVPFSDHLHFLECFGNRFHHDKMSAFDPLNKSDSELITPHNGPSMPFHPHFPYYLPTQVLPSVYTGEPEQTEALSLIVNTPKKKRTKVTDTRLSSPRGKSSVLQDNTPSSSMDHTDAQRHLAVAFPHFLPPVLPTSVAITNPSLSHSDFLALRLREASSWEPRLSSPQDQSRGSPRSLTDSPQFMSKMDMYDRASMSLAGDLMDGSSSGGGLLLRKAKLMFFFTRYPSSSILKMYFPDVMFNKNNTAQLVKWFSNFREFFYIQMEKYARQALAEGCKHADDLVVNADSELFRHLNLHYNRNNQLEVPHNFLAAVQAALKEFFKSVQSNKDAEPSWKKSIYKIIARMDETLPDFFKSPNWMEQLGDQ